MVDPLKKLLALFSVVLFSCPTFGTTLLSSNYSFESPVVSNSGTFARIELNGTTPFLRTGAPVVPCFLVNVPVPFQTQTGDLKLEATAESICKSVLPLPPDYTRPPCLVGSNPPPDPQNGPDQEIYSSNTFYPTSDAELVSLQRSGEKTIAVIRIFPVRINPVTREMRVASSLSLRLTSSKPLHAMKRMATHPLDNSWRYLLITTNTLVEAFEPLVSFKRKNGTAVHVETVNDIYREYTGEDAPAKIRACIRDGYENHGTKYVLLGGGTDAVPMRGAYGLVGETVDEHLITDLYYACLDGTWDGNDNGIYGEPNDGDLGEDVDLVAEVHTGRAPVNTPAEAKAFVAKTIRYSSEFHPKTRSVLLAAEYLGEQQIDNLTLYAQGDTQLKTLLPFFNDHDITWLNDSPEHKATWLSDDILSEIKKTPNIIAHIGHGDPYSCMRLHAFPASFLENSFPFVLHSIACEAGKIDVPGETFAEAILNHSTGAAAAVLNTRVGWFDAYNPAHYSGEFQTAFFKQAAAMGLPIGEAMSRARESLVGKVEDCNVNERPYRWTYYSSTLFGDPQLTIQPPADWSVQAMDGTTRTFLHHDSPSPRPFEFEIFNHSDHAKQWKVDVSEPFLVPARPSGSIAPKTSVKVGIDFDMSAIPAPGDHTAHAHFTCPTATNGYVFPLDCTVLQSPGTSDSSEDPTDGRLAFADTMAGLVSPRGTLTISNKDPKAPLVIHTIKIDGRDCSLAGMPVDLFCFDVQSEQFCSVRNETGAAPEPLDFPLDAGSLSALEIVRTQPGRIDLYGLDVDANQLHQYDYTTGMLLASIDVSPRDKHVWSGLAYNRQDGSLYASSTDLNESTLYHVDLNNLAFTQLATLPGRSLVDIAIDARGTLFGIDIERDTLLAIDPFNGKNREIGPLGLDANYYQGMTFDSRGEKLLWASFTSDIESSLRLLDPSTAQSVVVTTFRYGQLADDYLPELKIAAKPEETAFRIGSELPISIPPGQSASIPVEFLPPRTGDFTSEITLYADDDRKPFARFECFGTSSRVSEIPLVWLNDNHLPTDGSANHLDTDGDGFTNTEEWQCGTDPKDPASRLRIRNLSLSQNGQITFTWATVPGRTYSLQQSDTPRARDFTTFGTRLATGPTLSVTDTIAKSNRFYRIKVERGN